MTGLRSLQKGDYEEIGAAVADALSGGSGGGGLSVSIVRSEMVEGEWGSGETDSDTIDLGAPYAFVVLRIPNTGDLNFPCELRALVGQTADDDLVGLFDRSQQSANLATLEDAPNNSLSFVFQEALGCQRIQFSLSAVTTGIVPIEVYGFDRVASA